MHRPELAAFIPLAGLTAWAGAAERHDIQVVPKVALVPTLLMGVSRRRRLSRALAFAGAAAAVGDWFMLASAARENDPPSSRRWMRRGAAAFGVQQVLYTGLLAHAGARPRAGALTAVAAVLGGLGALEMRGTPPDPVLTAYGASLGATAVLSQDGGCHSAWGGRLFLASDAAIIIRPHLPRQAQPAAEAFVLVTYAAAQALLVEELAR